MKELTGGDYNDPAYLFRVARYIDTRYPNASKGADFKLIL